MWLFLTNISIRLPEVKLTLKLHQIGGALLIMGFATTSYAQDSDAAAQANNPLANMTAFNIQNYYIGRQTETGKEANQFWLRYAQPFSVAGSKWLMRASLPVSTFPVNNHHETGMGDLNIFTAYLVDTGNPAVSFGIGPQLTAPTATDKNVGSEKWSAGLVNVLFDASSAKFQYGYLLSWQSSFAGSSQREDANLVALQPFAMYQLGGGTYLRSAPIWTYNLKNDGYSVPIGIGVGQVVKRQKTVYNFFVEPQFSAASRGPGQPDWQIYFGLNMQFLN